MGSRADVRAIRARAVLRVRAEQDPDRAMAVALAGLWDAVEVLSEAIDADDDARDELARLVDSLPCRLGHDEHADLAAAMSAHLAGVVASGRVPR